jgi:hypothetical protein
MQCPVAVLQVSILGPTIAPLAERLGVTEPDLRQVFTLMWARMQEYATVLVRPCKCASDAWLHKLI